MDLDRGLALLLLLFLFKQHLLSFLLGHVRGVLVDFGWASGVVLHAPSQGEIGLATRSMVDLHRGFLIWLLLARLNPAWGLVDLVMLLVFLLNLPYSCLFI